MRTKPAATRNKLERTAKPLMEVAKAKRHTLVAAESCTAGLMGRILSDAPGAAACFHGSFVTYTKEQKTRALDVPSAARGTPSLEHSWLIWR